MIIKLYIVTNNTVVTLKLEEGEKIILLHKLLFPKRERILSKLYKIDKQESITKNDKNQ